MITRRKSRVLHGLCSDPRMTGCALSASVLAAAGPIDPILLKLFGCPP